MSAAHRVGPFVLGQLLGRGATAEVWAATHAPSERQVALKLFRREAVSGLPLGHIAREVRAVASLDHPSIVRVYDQGTIDDAGPWSGGTFLAMELATLGTLRARRGRASWGWIHGALACVLDALAHAHARGLIHRDIKPTNILLGGERCGVVVSDWGLAERSGEASADVSWGTPATMAPEQVEGRLDDLGPWTDLYALGCTAWALVTGHAPFSGRPPLAILEAQVREEPPALVPAVDVPAGLEEWLRKLLAKRPEDRFLRARQAQAALEALPELFEDEDTDDPRTSIDLHPESPRAAPEGLGLGLWGLRPVPLAGRQEAMSQVDHAFAQVVRERRPRLLWVRGAAGVGKSRLCESFVERVHQEALGDVWVARHGPAAGLHDGLLAMWTRRVRGADRGLEAGSAADLGLAPVDEVPLVHELLRNGGDRLLPAERHELVLRSILRGRVGEGVVVWLDDLQWGLDSLEFARRVLVRGEGAVLLLATLRDEALPEEPEAQAQVEALSARPDVDTLALERLAAGTCGGIVRAMLGLELEAAEAVEARASGNPLYAVQLVDHWVRQGRLVATQAGFMATAPLEPPETLVQVWQSRVDHVLSAWTAAEAQAWEVAAVLGQAWDPDEWRAVCTAEGLHPDPAFLESLARLRLLRSSADRPGHEFVHGLLRECLEERAHQAGRRERWHLATARWLAPRTDIESLLRRLHHQVEAEVWNGVLDDAAAAARALSESLDEARLQWAHRQAMRAWEALGRPRDERWIQVELSVVHLLALRSLRSETRARLDALSAWIGDTELSAFTQALLGLRYAMIESGDGYRDQALARLTRLLERADVRAHPEASNRLKIACGRIYLWAGRYERALEMGRSVDLTRGHPGDAVYADALLGNALTQLGRLDEAVEYLERAVARAEQGQLRIHLATIYSGLGNALRMRRDHQGAREVQTQALRVAELHDQPHEIGVTRANLALTELDLGRAEEALAWLEIPVHRLTRAGESVEFAIHTIRFIAWLRLGRWDDLERQGPLWDRLPATRAIADPEMGTLLEEAAGTLQALTGRPLLTAQAWRLAAAVWRECGQTEAEARCRARAATAS